MRFPQTRALIGKELAQHRRILIGLSLLLALFWLVGWFTFLRSSRSVSVLEILPGFLLVGLPAAAVVLGHRLVVAEYYGRTQRFLEALPLRRSEEALVKAGLGLGIVGAWAAAGFAATAAQAVVHEPLEPRFLIVLGTRIAAFVFVCWGAAFLFSVFGRLRLPLLIGIAVGLSLLAQNAEVSLGNWGPLALVHPSTLPVERIVLPKAALVWSCAIGAACFALALALIRLREGSIIESLARPLSLREKAALLVVASGGLVVLSVAEKRKLTPMPRHPEEQQVLRAGTLEIAYLDEALRLPAQRLAATLSPLLDAVAQVLPPPRLRLRVVHGSDVPPERPQLTSVHAKEGAIVRVNLATFAAPPAPSGHAARVIADLLHAQIFASAGHRVFTEPKHWLLDGFTLYLATRGVPGRQDQPQLGAPPTARAPDLVLDGALVAAHASNFATPTSESLARYFVLAEELGEFPAAALAASGWIHLEQRAGVDQVWALAQAAFRRAGTNDARDFLNDRRWPMARLFTQATGIAWDDFVLGWRGWLAELGAEPAMAARLARLPRARIAVDVTTLGADAVTVRGRFAVPPAGAECAALHRGESWFDTGPQPDLLDENRLTLTSGEPGFERALEGDYDSGERVFLAIDCRTPEAPFGVRLYAGRVTIP